MQQVDDTNTLFSLAADMVNLTSEDIFLTGKAGTGKTTFLKYIRENCPKQLAVVAPTGVAAINAGGVTIHSFFQLPFSPFIPEVAKFTRQATDCVTGHTLISRLRINGEKKKVFQQLELLIIDEISMVRCDVLDAIDLLLRHYRSSPAERFGGVQLLFIGDMYQLPPVVKEAEWNLLKDYYGSPFFFDSQVVKQAPPVHIEFTKIYRQTESNFINLLNQVRNNELDSGSLEELHGRMQAATENLHETEHILLTTHNDKAKNINEAALAKIDQPTVSFRAEVKDDFPPSAFPVSEFLLLKVGAQVMFIKNDTEKIRRYYNGKIGVVTELNNEQIFVQCKGDAEPIEVKKERWTNIRYSLNKTTRQLDEEEIGSFTQFPLRLAWAITIHKSQGLTFEKAVIDAGAAFAPGQVYVALSRCSSFEGMVLQSRINKQSLTINDRIVQFSKACGTIDQLQLQLANAKRSYQQKMTLQLFDFSKAINTANELQKYLNEHQKSFNPEAVAWIKLLVEGLEDLQATVSKFQAQLKGLFAQDIPPEENTFLKKRLAAAVVFFLSACKEQSAHILRSTASTDSSMHAKEFNDTAKSIFADLELKSFMFQGFSGNFNMQVYHRRRKAFTMPYFPVNAYAATGARNAEVAHPVLLQKLREVRDSICAKSTLPIYVVAGTKTLEEIANYLPLTAEALEKIIGFGKVKVKTYGEQFLKVVQEYCESQGLESLIHQKPVKKKSATVKTNTKRESFELFRSGKSIADIAAERKLAQSTIESHLAYYVQQGKIPIETLVKEDKLKKIRTRINAGEDTVAAIKASLGAQVSFGEIKFVLASQSVQQDS
jgi:hypothetical protein